MIKTAIRKTLSFSRGSSEFPPLCLMIRAFVVTQILPLAFRRIDTYRRYTCNKSLRGRNAGRRMEAMPNAEVATAIALFLSLCQSKGLARENEQDVTRAHRGIDNTYRRQCNCTSVSHLERVIIWKISRAKSLFVSVPMREKVKEVVCINIIAAR